MTNSRTRGPQIDVAGLRIFAERSGTRVTGRVEFPYEVSGRTHVPIDYHSVRSDPTLDPMHSTIDHRAAERVRLVRAWQRACGDMFENLVGVELRPAARRTSG